MAVPRFAPGGNQIGGSPRAPIWIPSSPSRPGKAAGRPPRVAGRPSSRFSPGETARVSCPMQTFRMPGSPGENRGVFGGRSVSPRQDICRPGPGFGGRRTGCQAGLGYLSAQASIRSWIRGTRGFVQRKPGPYAALRCTAYRVICRFAPASLRGAIPAAATGDPGRHFAGAPDSYRDSGQRACGAVIRRGRRGCCGRSPPSAAADNSQVRQVRPAMLSALLRRIRPLDLKWIWCILCLDHHVQSALLKWALINSDRAVNVRFRKCQARACRPGGVGNLRGGGPVAFRFRA